MRKTLLLTFILFVSISFSGCEKIIQLYFMSPKTEVTPMKFYLPKGDKGKDFIVNNNTYTVILFNNQKAYTYQGSNIKKEIFLICDMGTSGEFGRLKAVLRLGKNSIGRDFQVIIKPSSLSTHKDVVDVLDLMHICGIKNYTLTDITKEEELMKTAAN